MLAKMKAEATPLAPTNNWHCLTGFYQCPSRAFSLKPTFLNRCKAQPSLPQNSSPCTRQLLRLTQFQA